ncbi:MAG TPA: Asp-tRNA(Asn)/Glu-tRNA(Gln) amidotransferase subunit GatB [Candidatus Humimicrobiaceae bacterium]|nr:Asp-tRNA(Asn)/Glu-tRNA(Gln) amidotransferase subunit GatB [Candidatus Humimicrobiaceae bacterium]
MTEYQPTIGLEIHVELRTKSKMFCSCPNDPDERNPNVNICPICLGHPGTLPVINQEAVKKVIKTGLALNCQIPEHSRFDRKNYFYPDLPKGYQISQLYQPLCKSGFLEIAEASSHLSLRSASPSSEIAGEKIKIREVHLEEDTAKLIHPEGQTYSLVDFNRAGVPLMELVTEPSIYSAKGARQFAEELKLILRYIDVSTADMEKGQMRVEANVSVSKDSKLGTKVELKNLNSFRALERGIEYETERQAEILKSGKKVVQETRGWDDIKSRTFSQREKEEAHDYRYFPEPDLPPLRHSKEFIDEIRAEIPELPQQKRERLLREYSLDEKSVEIFVYNKNLGEYFEKVTSELPPNLTKDNLSRLIKLTSNYMITDLQGLLKGVSVASKNFRITPENFAEFITLIHEGKISSKIAKQVLSEMFKTGADPSHIIEEKGLTQMTDEFEIEKIIKEVISKNPKAAKDFKSGKANAFQYLIGQIMAATKGKANPETVSRVLTKLLKDV